MTTVTPQPDSSVMPAAMSYDVASDSVNLAFDNPGYVTHKDIENQPHSSISNGQGPPLPSRTQNGQGANGQGANNVNLQNRLNGHYANRDKDGFENAMYDTMGATANDYEPLPEVKEMTMK